MDETEQPREHRVPCQFASFNDAKSGRHMTPNLDRVCDRCRARIDAEKASA